MSEHTPGPWAWDDAEYGIVARPTPPGYEIIAACPEYDAGNWDNNAARIVQCVNSHDALVEALQGFAEYYEDLRSGRPTTVGMSGDGLLVQARAALKLAKGEKEEKYDD